MWGLLTLEEEHIHVGAGGGGRLLPAVFCWLHPHDFCFHYRKV